MDIRGRGAGRYKFCRKNCHFAGKLPFQLLYRFRRCHLYVTCFFPTCFRFLQKNEKKTLFYNHLKPQKPLEMTIKAHSAVLNVHFYHHLHLPTSFLGYRTQFKLIKFNSVLIVPNSLKKRHFEPQKPLEMAMKPHSAVLNVKFYYYS